jgi:hypothetical protein
VCRCGWCVWPPGARLPGRRARGPQQHWPGRLFWQGPRGSLGDMQQNNRAARAGLYKNTGHHPIIVACSSRIASPLPSHNHHFLVRTRAFYSLPFSFPASCIAASLHQRQSVLNIPSPRLSLPRAQLLRVPSSVVVIRATDRRNAHRQPASGPTSRERLFTLHHSPSAAQRRTHRFSLPSFPSSCSSKQPVCFLFGNRHQTPLGPQPTFEERRLASPLPWYLPHEQSLQATLCNLPT